MGKRQPTYFQNLNGWVAEAANETGKTGATLPPLLPAMFRAFEQDDSVDPPYQETPGFSHSLTPLIQNDEERRSVYAEIGSASCGGRVSQYGVISLVAVVIKKK